MTSSKQVSGFYPDKHGRAPSLYAWLGTVVTFVLLIAAQLLPRGDQPLLRATGVFMLLLAGVFIITPFYLLSRYGGSKEGASYLQSSRLVDRGFYGLVRHPQYLGYILLASGFALISAHWITALLGLIVTACFYAQTVQEEAFCLEQFGSAYTNYLQSVPRLNLVRGLWRMFCGKAIME